MKNASVKENQAIKSLDYVVDASIGQQNSINRFFPSTLDDFFVDKNALDFYREYSGKSVSGKFSDQMLSLKENYDAVHYEDSQILKIIDILSGDKIYRWKYRIKEAKKSLGHIDKELRHNQKQKLSEMVSIIKSNSHAMKNEEVLEFLDDLERYIPVSKIKAKANTYIGRLEEIQSGLNKNTAEKMLSACIETLKGNSPETWKWENRYACFQKQLESIVITNERQEMYIKEIKDVLNTNRYFTSLGLDPSSSK